MILDDVGGKEQVRSSDGRLFQKQGVVMDVALLKNLCVSFARAFM